MADDNAAGQQAGEPHEGGAPAAAAPVRRKGEPANHRTVDRVTQIVEEVVYNPGMTFVELAKALQAPRSSVYGFIQGLKAKGWLYELNRRFYLGPAVYGLTLASGHLRAGMVSHDHLAQLHHETGVTAFLQVRAGDHVFSVAEAGSDAIADFEARTNIRRTLIATAAGKVMLAARAPAEVEAYLRGLGEDERDMVAAFLSDYPEIRRSGVATNTRLSGTRFAISALVRNKSGEGVAAVTLVGRTEDIAPRAGELTACLLRHTAEWSRRDVRPREAI